MGMRWYAGRIEAGAVARARLAAEAWGEDEDPFDGLVTGTLVDIDKAWHGIHRLLAGTTWEATPGAGSAILGGETLIDEDGTISVLGPDEVRAVADGLAILDPAEVAGRYDPEVFAAEGIYPDVWRAEGRAALDDYLLPHLDTVTRLYAEAAAAGDGLLVFLE